MWGRKRPVEVEHPDYAYIKQLELDCEIITDEEYGEWQNAQGPLPSPKGRWNNAGQYVPAEGERHDKPALMSHEAIRAAQAEAEYQSFHKRKAGAKPLPPSPTGRRQPPDYDLINSPQARLVRRWELTEDSFL